MSYLLKLLRDGLTRISHIPETVSTHEALLHINVPNQINPLSNQNRFRETIVMPNKSKLLKSFDALLAGQNNGGDFAEDEGDDVGDGTRAALAGRDSDGDGESEQVGSGVLH